MGSVCVINLKGGCGKTTVCTHLAAAFALSGLTTALADLDRQQNALLWHRLRGGQRPKIRALNWREDFGKVPKSAQRTVIDCPASLRARNVREVVREADLVIVPVLPSVYDEESTRMFLGRIEKLKPIRKRRKPVLLVANRYRPNSVAASRLEAFADANAYSLVARIPDRALYPSVAEHGLTVFDYGSQTMRAQQEYWMPLLDAVERHFGALQPDAAFASRHGRTEESAAS